MTDDTTPDAPGPPDMIGAMRRLSRDWHHEISRLVALGHMTFDAAQVESRQMTLLLFRAEKQLLGVPYDLRHPPLFSDHELGAYLARHIARLRTGHQDDDANALARLQDELSLGIDVLRLPGPPDTLEAEP